MPAVKNYLSTSLEKDGIFKISDKNHAEEDRALCAIFSDGEAPSDFGLVIYRDGDTVDPNRKYISVSDFDDLDVGDVFRVDLHTRRLVFLFKKNSRTNSLYVTDLCNSHCLMCPQPPQETDSVIFEELRQVVSLLPEGLEEISITGGEPTQIGDRLPLLLRDLASRAPDCYVHMLTNARRFSDWKTVQSVSGILRNLSVGVPLYSFNPEKHDYIVQRKGAFDETLDGILNLGKAGIPIEIRVVLHQQTIPDLSELSHFIYRNIPFVFQVSFMGMEQMGYVKKNWDQLWISPLDYQEQLVSATRALFLRGIPVRIFNLPFCHLDKRLWKFTADSISDFKKYYKDCCNECIKKTVCGGLFHYQANRTEVFPIKSENC